MPINSIEEVIRRVRSINHEETRRESEDYLELVTKLETIGSLKSIFEGYFGPAFKPAGQEACDESEKHAKAHGGILEDQVLYYTDREGFPNTAMIWPWQDGKRATIKIIQGLEPVD